MKIPKVVKKDNREYIFVKKYPNHFMYRDVKLGTNTCFLRHDLGLLKEMMKPSRDLLKIHKT